MSGKKYRLLRKEAEKHNIPYWLVKRVYKTLSPEKKKKLLTTDNS